jgi:sterol desaturase/sphingolipid hydroxylase (fatty acid hydroxylase superfamily)
MQWDAQLESLSLLAIGFYVSLILLELGLELFTRRHYYRLGDTLCSVSTGIAYTLMQLVMRGVSLAALVYASQFALFEIENSWWTVALCYLAVDFIFYWHHRIIHEVRVGWAAHIVHHSSTHYNLGGTALRQSIFEAIYEPWFYLPLVILGFEPIMVLIALQLNLAYMFWPHTQRIHKLHPWIEWLFVTPAHHRVHHACNLNYLDKNYSGTFIIWDRLFGTFAEETEAPTFGVLTPIESDNPAVVTFTSWRHLFQDLKTAPNLAAVLGYLFLPPGWAPNGRGMTTRQMQARGEIVKPSAT